MRADRIAVVDQGRVVEVGSHAELAAVGGVYADLHRTWMAHLDGGEAAASGNGERGEHGGNGR
jgi:hypothetical protein